MFAVSRNNRLVPAVIIAVCLCVSYRLIDPNVNNWANVLPQWRLHEDSRGSLASATPATASPYPSSSIASRPTLEVPESSDPSAPHRPTSANLSADDVLLIMKTGSTSMWKRLLIHLTTTFSPNRIPSANIAIYSDGPDSIANFRILDALANISDATKASPDFDVYRQQPEYATHNVYVEAAGIDGDNYGPAGGWIVDKYKFLPLMEHAGKNWPRVKWYIYQEDDAWLFLPSVLDHLAAFDWRKPHYLGSYAAKSDTKFAHGGAGFALSRAAWEQTFGRNPTMSEDYEDYTAGHCCGDQVLGHALNKYGVRFGENGGDEKFTWGFNPIVHWRFGFSRWNWCTRLMSWHKVHSRDVAQYFDFERAWDFSKPLLHRDFFLGMIAPNLKRRAEWFDNFSSLYMVTSENQASPPTPDSQYDSALWRQAWVSTDACEAACKSWVTCVQWSYVEDLCRMDDKLIMGQGFAPAMSERKTALKTTSGWLQERLEGWKCD
ncbi:glycosyltransferase [Staphylotrichum tortipilum]|uniref:Glycosyltransferase n=1 Tax=Staphylotrichum tortipilum TaxID=2831512 RepID=A0AAN6MA35_9PEZI|nr:glycosyltransferase [Staphylotrichum longicolle]